MRVVYWQERMAKSQDKISQKKAKDIDKQIAKYYKQSMDRVIGAFEKTYQKIESAVAAGKEPTPADLYKLDTYWKMQAELREELQQLGEKQSVLYSKEFEAQYEDIYNSIALHSDTGTFNSVAKDNVSQMVNEIWCADGKSWSQRVWDNTDKLQDALNEELLHCVVTGKTSSDLKKRLMRQFNVSYNRADTLVRTELAHIQTEAARNRYRDAGLKEVEVWADEDERRCEYCGSLHEKRFPINGKMPVPAHPKCRCCIVPVLE